jgi:hypothetical protein
MAGSGEDAVSSAALAEKARLPTAFLKSTAARIAGKLLDIAMSAAPNRRGATAA